MDNIVNLDDFRPKHVAQPQPHPLASFMFLTLMFGIPIAFYIGVYELTRSMIK